MAHPFLKDLIDCFGRHDVTREQVWELFRHYSKSARIIEIKSDEFDDAVSYTHLDVYKRQGATSIALVMLFTAFVILFFNAAIQSRVAKITSGIA